MRDRAIGVFFVVTALVLVVAVGVQVASLSPDRETILVPAGAVFRLNATNEYSVMFNVSGPATLLGAWSSDQPTRYFLTTGAWRGGAFYGALYLCPRGGCGSVPSTQGELRLNASVHDCTPAFLPQATRCATYVLRFWSEGLVHFPGLNETVDTVTVTETIRVVPASAG